MLTQMQMKRKIFTLLLVMLAIGANCRQPERGYRGFVEWDNRLTSYDEFIPGNSVTYYYTGVSTSHGYQFNPYFFLGAGLAIDCSTRGGSAEILVFLQARGDFKFGRFTPFADLRGGYTLTNNGGWIFSPTVGYRFNWGRKVGVNVGVGLMLRVHNVDNYDVSINPDGYWIMTSSGQTHYTKAMFAFRVGFDF